MMHLPVSVQALRTRDRCQRFFTLQYRGGRYWPGLVREPSADMHLGEVFHKLVVRHRLGLEVSPPAELARAWAGFLASRYALPRGPGEAVEIGGPDAPGQPDAPNGTGAPLVFSEQVLQFSLEGVPFLVRCDEIRRQGDQWTILDWKTGRVRESELAGHWQTRLYRFALALAGSAIGAGGAIPAPNIKMVYLLVRLEKALEFPYDLAAFEADRQLFTEIARQAAIPAESLAWPEDPETCRTCRFDTLCNARPAPPVSTTVPHLPRFV